MGCDVRFKSLGAFITENPGVNMLLPLGKYPWMLDIHRYSIPWYSQLWNLKNYRLRLSQFFTSKIFQKFGKRTHQQNVKKTTHNTQKNHWYFIIYHYFFWNSLQNTAPSRSQNSWKHRFYISRRSKTLSSAPRCVLESEFKRRPKHQS